MQKMIIILFSILFTVCCKKYDQIKSSQLKSNFNLEKDFENFQTIMTVNDTLKVWINRSVCIYQGSERLEITKKGNSIKIKTEYREETFEQNQNSKWKVF